MVEKINNVFVNYRVSQNGEKNKWVLFLHGWGGSMESFRYFENILFNDGFNVVNIDLPNFGHSQKIESRFTLIDYAKTINQILILNNIKKVNIVCHSFGSRISLILARFLPQKIESLVIVDGAGIRRKRTLKEKINLFRFKLLKNLNKSRVFNFNLSNFGSEDYKLLNNEQKQNFVEYINADLSFLLKNILVPTLIIWGEKDKDTPLYMAKKMHKNIKNSGLIVFKGSGHFSYIENKEDFVIILKNFLN